MNRLLAALVLGFAITAPAFAADREVKLTLDGRPVDSRGGIALERAGVIYANLVPLVKTFDGLLTLQGNAITVSVGGTTARFTEGSRTALVKNDAVTMRGPAFKHNGDLFVPLETFVTRVANASLRVDPSKTHADIHVNLDPLS